MKTIMIRDEVYQSLAAIKGTRSFGETISAILNESKSSRNKELEKYFGSISASQAAKMRKNAQKAREEIKARI